MCRGGFCCGRGGSLFINQFRKSNTAYAIGKRHKHEMSTKAMISHGGKLTRRLLRCEKVRLQILSPARIHKSHRPWLMARLKPWPTFVFEFAVSVLRVTSRRGPGEGLATGME